LCEIKIKEYQEILRLIHRLYINPELRAICKLALVGKFKEAKDLEQYFIQGGTNESDTYSDRDN